MLRFDVATNSTAGLTEDVEEFKRSYGISPLHNIHLSASQYPGIFVTTSNEYPIPLAYKYVAQLQYTLGHEVRQVCVLSVMKSLSLLLKTFQTNFKHDYIRCNLSPDESFLNESCARTCRAN